ncbi:hypothetical protein IRZ71_06720 [Flavobacterium sp. ANB]|uniref:hypothetical protein n=1 Tax=unclassified Flavobacterium TaxID=196869 RepID=UPI0012B7A58F|nr:MULTISPECIES: hypothetical protein [unclassified Flavobacterium]MBF4516026.1 hypothetical protein [Flavobacterium sp. ANB]MTD69028.1 hypothetical protein [Flavobacterium sp. LC2016-13]
MTKQELLFHLKGASFVALKFAENYVKDKLTTNFRYNVIFTPANTSGNIDQFDIYPEDEGIIKLNLSDNEVVDLLYRKNKIPIWIDINVLKVNGKTTILNLACAGRYSENKEVYYYNDDGFAPFGIKGPTFPIGHKEGKKFRL